MVILAENDAVLLFADYLKQVHVNREYFSGTVALGYQGMEVLCSYQIFTDPELYYELEYVVAANGVEVKKGSLLEKRSFENRFRVLMADFIYNMKQIHEKERVQNVDELFEIEFINNNSYVLN